MKLLKLYAGFDPREEAGFHVFCSSVLARSSIPVSITALHNLNFDRAGSNAFTFSRFLVPYLQGFEGTAIFMDGSDMLCRGDLAELLALANGSAVQVVKHAYKTRHPRKYVGSDMECGNTDYERKQWASVMVMNCAKWAHVTPDFVAQSKALDLLQLRFLEEIGELPKVWNWLADEDGPNPEAKVLHWTAGTPGFHHYKDAPHANEWNEQRESVGRIDQ